MPYAEDGETWLYDEFAYEEGMAENMPGHKPFVKYDLPRWCSHPLTQPFTGRPVLVKDYAYSCKQGVNDGMFNQLSQSAAHIAALFGDLKMLQTCLPEEINSTNVFGETPAHGAADVGIAWVLQWLVENNYDTTSPNNAGWTPGDLIWMSPRLHNSERNWCAAALTGELTAKKADEAMDYKIHKMNMGIEYPDPKVVEYMKETRERHKWELFRDGTAKIPYVIPAPANHGARTDLVSSKVNPISARPPSALPVALLFPGQGSQYVGMLRDCSKMPVVQDLLERAKAVLGYDIRDLCVNGPEAKLNQTQQCQPAMFVAGMAALEVLREKKPEVVERPQACAGLSLGEYTALCAAGVLDFEDGLRLVQLRAEAMQDAATRAPQAMCSVAGVERSKLEKLCEKAKALDTTTTPECRIANYLFPQGFTCGGSEVAIAKLCDLALSEASALQAKTIKTSGAFHTPMMKPAEERLIKALDESLPKMKPPRCALYFNVNAKRVPAGTQPTEFIGLMKQQLTSEVKWATTVENMIGDRIKDFYEVGPLKQLKSMLKRIDPEAFKRTESVLV